MQDERTRVLILRAIIMFEINKRLMETLDLVVPTNKEKIFESFFIDHLLHHLDFNLDAK